MPTSLHKIVASQETAGKTFKYDPTVQSFSGVLKHLAPFKYPFHIPVPPRRLVPRSCQWPRGSCAKTACRASTANSRQEYSRKNRRTPAAGRRGRPLRRPERVCKTPGSVPPWSSWPKCAEGFWQLQGSYRRNIVSAWRLLPRYSGSILTWAMLSTSAMRC